MLRKKIIQITIVLFLVLFSFYYTNKTIDIIKESDPLMKRIKEESGKYEITAEDAMINENKIIPGKKGKKVDYDETYTKMKRYGAYNESLTVFKETSPTVSIENNYDKFIISGNEEKKAVTLVFAVTQESNPNEIIRILNQENTLGTFFIDGLWLENNLSIVKQILNHELEILSYNNRYEEIYFSSALQYLKNVAGNTPKYCYAEYDNKEVIELCSKLKLHTIVPTIKISSSPFQEIKTKLQNASIISLPINKVTEAELKTVIKFIKSKGYKIVNLEELLSEEVEK